MEQRRYFENNLRNQIKQLTWYNKRDEEKIGRMLKLNDEFSHKQIIKTQDDIQYRKSVIQDYHQQISLCRQGLMDNKLEQERHRNAKIVREQNNMKTQKYRYEMEKKKKQSNELRQRQESDKKSDRQSRNLERDIASSYKYYCNMCDKIPDYIQKNLNEMPNNKGYIWKGIHMFGKLPKEEDKPKVMFEKPVKDVLHIHEWYKGEYKKFEKVGKNKKQLIEHTYYTVRDLISSLMDYAS